MSEHQRPPAIPYDSDLARRAEQPRFGADRLVSAVAYHAGPEIAVTTVVGGAGALLVHPAALPVVAAVTAVYAVVDRVTRRRATGPSQARPSAEPGDQTADAATTASSGAETTTDERTEGIA